MLLISILCLVLSFAYGLGVVTNPIAIVTHPYPQTWYDDLRNTQLLCSFLIPNQTLQNNELPEVNWYKDGADLKVRMHQDGIPPRLRIYKQRVRTLQTITSVLNFKYVTESIAGVYKCNVQYNGNRLESGNAKIYVLSKQTRFDQDKPPVITLGPPSVYHINPSGKFPLNVPCEFDSTEDFDFTWKCFEVDGHRKRLVNIGTSFPSDDYGYNLQFIGTPSLKTALARGVDHYEAYCNVTNPYGTVQSAKSMLIFKYVAPGPVIDMKHIESISAQMKWCNDRTVQVENLMAEVALTSTVGAGSVRSFKIGPVVDGVHKLNLLRPAVQYSLKMRCVNEQGPSEWSNVVSFMTSSDKPTAPPRNIDIFVISPKTVRVSWENIPTEKLNGELTGFNVKYFIGQSSSIFGNEMFTTKNNMTWKSFQAGTYFIGVAGVTNGKVGRYSGFYPVFLPMKISDMLPKITNMDIHTTNASFTFTLFAKSVCRMKITTENSQKQIVYDIQSRVTVNGLKPYTDYYTSVECDDMYGGSKKYGDLGHFRTNEGVPTSAPNIISVSYIEDRHGLAILWEDVDEAELNGILKGFMICTSDRTTTNDCRRYNITHESIIYIEPFLFRSTKLTMSACTNAGCGRASENFHNRSPSLPPSIVAYTSESFHNRAPSFPPSIVEGTVVAVFLGIIVIVLGVYCYRRHGKRGSNSRGSVNNSAEYAPALTENIDNISTTAPPDTIRDCLASNISTEKKLDGFQIPRSALVMKDILGKGEFGYVYKAILKPYNVKSGELEVKIPISVAVKSMKLEIARSNDQEEFIREGLRMKGLKHPNVIHLVGVCLTGLRESVASNSSSIRSNRSYIQMVSQGDLSPLVVLPYLPNGSLRQHLFDARTAGRMSNFTSYSLLKFASDISEGMTYLADKSIIHRDLAARNCLLDENFNVVVSDFGLSRKTYYKSYYRQKTNTKVPVKWMAIESLDGSIYTEKTDVWAFGVTFWEILTFCQNPYPGVPNHELCELLKNGTRLTKPILVPDDLWRLVTSCWEESPEERPSFVCIKNKMQGLLLNYSTKEFSEADNLYVNVTTRLTSEYVEPIPVSPVRGHRIRSTV